MKFVNGWRYLYKDSNRIEVKFRVGKLTVFTLYVDFSDREVLVTVFNFGIGF